MHQAISDQRYGWNVLEFSCNWCSGLTLHQGKAELMEKLNEEIKRASERVKGFRRGEDSSFSFHIHNLSFMWDYFPFFQHISLSTLLSLFLSFLLSFTLSHKRYLSKNKLFCSNLYSVGYNLVLIGGRGANGLFLFWSGDNSLFPLLVLTSCFERWTMTLIFHELPPSP